MNKKYLRKFTFKNEPQVQDRIIIKCDGFGVGDILIYNEAEQENLEVKIRLRFLNEPTAQEFGTWSFWTKHLSPWMKQKHILTIILKS
jgi:hypothetical protein